MLQTEAVKIRCIFGHEAQNGVYNAGLIVGSCHRCKQDVIRQPGGRWYRTPRNMVVRYRSTGAHAAPASKIVRQARREAPFLHRLPRKRSMFDLYYS